MFKNIEYAWKKNNLFLLNTSNMSLSEKLENIGKNKAEICFIILSPKGSELIYSF